MTDAELLIKVARLDTMLGALRLRVARLEEDLRIERSLRIKAQAIVDKRNA